MTQGHLDPDSNKDCNETQQGDDNFDEAKLQSSPSYSIMFPGRKSGFRDGFGLDSNREGLEIGPPAGLRRPEGRS